jgi:hypothetical protein
MAGFEVTTEALSFAFLNTFAIAAFSQYFGTM